VILITGATGVVGGRTRERLLATGHQVRGLSRTRSDQGFVRGDLSDATTLAPALADVDTVFLIWKQVTTENPERAIEAIARSSATRVVYLSSVSIRDELETQVHPMAATHLWIERLVRDSGLDWTILRSSWFMANTIGWADEIRTTGAVRFPFPAARRSPVDQRDVAEVAASVLTEPRHDGSVHLVTGPEVLTQADLIETIGEALGRTIASITVSPEAYREEMVAEGMPPALADAANAHWRFLIDHPEPIAPTVPEIAGHQARTFRAWAEAHASAFR
jgi:uncharacterized protein YbjT (DUF2867 family)